MEDHEKSKKRVDKNILDLFMKLTYKDSNVRIKSCASILRSVQKKQEEVGNNEVSTELQYCVERLVKGLASSRDAARLGFSLLLAEILKHYDDVHVEEVLELMKKHLSYSTKQEKRDAVFGQLFAYSAIVRSGRLANHSYLSYVVTELHDLWQGKSYVISACYQVMADLFSQLSMETFKSNVWPHIKDKLSGGWESCTADLLWLLLLSIRLFPESVNEKYLNKNWGNVDILSSENYDHLKKIIRQTTACLPVLHPMCVEFVTLCIGRKDLKSVWNAVVDENLFDADQTEKAFVGFEMIKHILQNNPKKKVVKGVLSNKFLTMFAKGFLIPKHPMHPAAAHLASFLCDIAKSNTDPEFQILILKVFLQPPGTVLSDQILKKKEVLLIIQNLLPEAVKAYCELLKSVAVMNIDSQDDVDSVNAKRFQAVVQIGSLIAHPLVLNDTNWKLDVIKFLFLRSFFTVNEPNADILHCEEAFLEIPKSLRESFVNAFYKALGSLYHRGEQQTAPLQHFLQQIRTLIEYSDLLLFSTDYVTPVFPLEQVLESWLKVKSITHKLAKQTKKDGKTNESNAFQALFLELGYHLFHDPKHISEVLEELHICCKKALSARKHSDEISDEEPPWASVVVDILLSLLSQPSLHLRRIVTSVFPLLCPFITQDALQQILSVINPEKNEDPMLVDGSEEENLDFDSGSSSDESESNEPDSSKTDEAFKKKIKDALGPAAEESDAESVVLSDSDMFKLDDALAKAFQSRVQTGHTQLSEEDQTMLHFRVRCFDLIMSFLKSEPPMHLVLQCIVPVLAAYELGHKGNNQKPLLHKAVSTLQILTRVKKFQNVDNVEKSELQQLLDILIAKCHKEMDLGVAQKLYTVCVFLVLCFRRLESQNISEKKTKKSPLYLEMYTSALEKFVKCSSSNMYPQFFVTLMEACPDLAFNFIRPSEEYAFDKDVRIYKRTQCLGLIFEALKFSKAQTNLNAEQWLEIGNTIVPKAVETLKDVLENSEIKPVFFTELLDVIGSCNSIVIEKTNESLIEKYSELLPLLSKIQMKNLTKKGKDARRKIILALGGNPNPKLNSKSEPAELEENQNSGLENELVDNIEIQEPQEKKRKSKSKKKNKKQKIDTVDSNEAVEDSS